MLVWPWQGNPAPGMTRSSFNDPQAPETHMRWVLIMLERKGVAAVQPSRSGLAASHSEGNHRFLSTSCR
jgi:hypothetical protein